MLGSVEELERDIEKFQSNIASSNEMVEQLRKIIEELKTCEAVIAEKSRDVVSQVSSVPTEVINRVREVSESNRNSFMRDSDDLLRKIDNQNKHVVDSINSSEKTVSETRDELKKTIDELHETQRHVKDIESDFERKCDAIISKIEALNLQQMNETCNRIENMVKGRTVLLMAMTGVAVICSILAIIF